MAGELISCVIPVFNERDSLAPLLAEIAAVAKVLPAAVEVLVVDDGSTDDSWAVVCALAAADPHVRGVRFRTNFGKAAALQAGFTAARGTTILTLDADLQDDPREIPRFLAALDSGLDVVSGWKQVRHDPWHKVFPSRVFNALVSRVTGVKLHDHNCGFKAYRAEVVRELTLYGERHRFVPVLAAARGFRVGELVVRHRSRQFGRSKFGWRRFIKGFLDLIGVRFTTQYGGRPLHWLGTLALVGVGLSTTLAVAAAAAWALGLPVALAVGLLAAAGVGLVLSAQAFLAGLVAELVVSQRAEPPAAYSVRDTTGG